MTRIVPRSEWGARYGRGAGPAPLPATYLHVHHSVTRAVNGPAIIRQLEQTGQTRFGAGISYTFAITPDGTIYEGHGIDREGTHTRGRNKTGRAIVLVGQFHPPEKSIAATQPTEAALLSLAELTAHGHRESWWPNRITSGHRDAPGASTACPGDWLNAQIPAVNKRVAVLLAPTTPAPSPEPEGTDMARAYRWPDGKVYAVTATSRRHVRNRSELNALAIGGLIEPVPEGAPFREDGWVRTLPPELAKTFDTIPDLSGVG